MIRGNNSKIYPIWTCVMNKCDNPDLPIGSVFEFEGVLFCVKNADEDEDTSVRSTCKLCFFNGSENCHLTPACACGLRKDNNNAYFEKI